MVHCATQVVSPVFVGGIGGSGTRILATLLHTLGYHIGEDLNDSLDNLWFTAFFKRNAVCTMDDVEFERLYAAFRSVSSGIPSKFSINLQEIEAAMLDPREQHPLSWLRQRKASLLHHLANLQIKPLWAWKEPNSHIVARRIMALDSEIRYIHLARNGLDMALSANQNQLQFWGHLAMSDIRSEIRPAQSLSYWCWAEQRVQQLHEEYPERVLWVRYEDLYYRTNQASKDVAQFLDLSGAVVEKILENVLEIPLTIGRFRQLDTVCFQEEDLQFVASLGFPVE